MWALYYSEEVKSYFVDNEPYCLDLLVQIETLKFASDAIPPEGLTPFDDPDEPNVYLWLIPDHAVILRKVTSGNEIHILAVRPLE